MAPRAANGKGVGKKKVASAPASGADIRTYFPRKVCLSRRMGFDDVVFSGWMTPHPTVSVCGWSMRSDLSAGSGSGAAGDLRVASVSGGPNWYVSCVFYVRRCDDIISSSEVGVRVAGDAGVVVRASRTLSTQDSRVGSGTRLGRAATAMAGAVSARGPGGCGGTADVSACVGVIVIPPSHLPSLALGPAGLQTVPRIAFRTLGRLSYSAAHCVF